MSSCIFTFVDSKRMKKLTGYQNGAILKNLPGLTAPNQNRSLKKLFTISFDRIQRRLFVKRTRSVTVSPRTRMPGRTVLSLRKSSGRSFSKLSRIQSSKACWDSNTECSSNQSKLFHEGFFQGLITVPPDLPQCKKLDAAKFRSTFSFYQAQ